MKRFSRATIILLILALLAFSGGCGKSSGNADGKDPGGGNAATEDAGGSAGQGTDDGTAVPDDSDVSSAAASDNGKTQGTPAGSNGASESGGQNTAADQAGGGASADQTGKVNSGSTLSISGVGVESPIALSLADLKGMTADYFEDDYFALNSYGTKAYFAFKGVKLPALLKKAGLKTSAKTITFIAADGYKQELTVEQALRQDYIDEQNPDKKYPVIIAWNENGADYDPEAGLPFRLVVGQKEAGDVNKPQWVSNIEQIVVE